MCSLGGRSVDVQRGRGNCCHIKRETLDSLGNLYVNTFFFSDIRTEFS